MPPIQRYQPAWRQISDHFKREILEGRLVTGDRLPSVRETAAAWDVSQGTAQQAYIHLHQAERLVRTDGTGTYVDAPRAVIGPQQRVRLTADPDTQPVEILSAREVPAPAYVASLLGSAEGEPVIRREAVTSRPGGEPYMLSVSWIPAQYGEQVPELFRFSTLPDARGAAHLIAERTGVPIGNSGAALECRQVKDDGRETAWLGLPREAYVLAGIHVWTAGGQVTEYEEYVLRPGQTVEFELEP